MSRPAHTCICNYCSYNQAMATNTNGNANTSAASNAPRGCTNFKLRQVLRSVSRLYDAELARAGLKTTQYSLLSHLLGLGPVAPGELARYMGMDASTLTRNVQLLVQLGWVKQGPGVDTRSRSLAITELGRAKQTEAKAYWKRAQLSLNDKLGPAQVAALHVLLDGAITQLHGVNDVPHSKVKR